MGLVPLIGHAEMGLVPLIGHAEMGLVPLIGHAEMGLVPLIGHAESGVCQCGPRFGDAYRPSPALKGSSKSETSRASRLSTRPPTATGLNRGPPGRVL